MRSGFETSSRCDKERIEGWRVGVRNAVWEGVRAGRRERKGRDEGLRMTV